MQWQPIETAPKDGTDILVFQPEYKECFVVYFRDGYWTYAVYENLTINLKDDPTHWMPLPPPPSQGEIYG